MKAILSKIFTYSISVLVTSGILKAQNVSIEDAVYFKYYPLSIEGGESMKDGEHYTVLTSSGIDKYSYKTSQKTETLEAGRFSDYKFDESENFLLLESNAEPIFRHSKRAKYTIKDLVKNTYLSVFNGKKIQEPLLSPNGKMVAFVYENNIYIQSLESNAITQITFDGKKNKIINGVTDWVYEEEFAFVRAFDWSADSKKIAFIRFDESEVPVMNIDVYGNQLYPSELSFKYPKAGEKNSQVSAWVYDIETKKSTPINLGEYTDFYIPKIQFNPYNNDLYLLIANRHQNQVDVLRVNTDNNTNKKLFTETDKAWIETDNFIFDFISPTQFLWTSERDGFRHLYLYDTNGKLKKQITKGNWEVTDFYGYNPKNKRIYYQSTENGSINRGVYSIALNGRNKQHLATKEGTNSAQFSKKFDYFILKYENANHTPVYTLNNGGNGELIRIIEDNQYTQNEIEKYSDYSPKEFKEININGFQLNSYMIKPKNFNPNKKYPLLMYLYNGPGSQQVQNKTFDSNFWWFQYLASKGYIIVCVDGRGTGFKGSAFKKATYKNLGDLEIKDQIAAAKYFGSLPYIDKDRIGMFGWSFGGYMTLLAMTKGADTFKAGIAVAPVTNWRFYDTIYTERYMTTPQENPAGYDDNSPLNFANLLKGNLLLIHGSADDNVHIQNSMRMAEALIQVDKNFDYMVYPDKNHGIYGGNTRLHLFKKISNYIFKNL